MEGEIEALRKGFVNANADKFLGQTIDGMVLHHLNLDFSLDDSEYVSEVIVADKKIRIYLKTVLEKVFKACRVELNRKNIEAAAILLISREIYFFNVGKDHKTTAERFTSPEANAMRAAGYESARRSRSSEVN